MDVCVKSHHIQHSMLLTGRRCQMAHLPSLWQFQTNGYFFQYETSYILITFFRCIIFALRFFFIWIDILFWSNVCYIRANIQLSAAAFVAITPIIQFGHAKKKAIDILMCVISSMTRSEHKPKASNFGQTSSIYINISKALANRIRLIFMVWMGIMRCLADLLKHLMLLRFIVVLFWVHCSI